MNETMKKFGYPATRVAEYAHWVVLLRPQAPTLGALVLIAKGDATAFGALDAAAFAEQARVIGDIERVLHARIGYARINYLMLMMADPHVHFHVIPRYDGMRSRDGIDYIDKGWPKLPDLGSSIPLTAAQIADQVAWLRDAWGHQG